MRDKSVALVTGANQGIGLQIANDLGAHGFNVLVGSRNFERGEVAAQGIGPDAFPIQLDVTDQALIAAAAKSVRDQFGRLDVPVNNAAIAHAGRLDDVSGKEYEKRFGPSVVPLDEGREVYETNVFGPPCGLPGDVAAPAGNAGSRVVNVSSVAGPLTLHSDPNFPFRPGFSPLDDASKAALNAMTLA